MQPSCEDEGNEPVQLLCQQAQMCREGREPASPYSLEGVLAHTNLNLPGHPSVTCPKKAIQT